MLMHTFFIMPIFTLCIETCGFRTRHAGLALLRLSIALYHSATTWRGLATYNFYVLRCPRRTHVRLLLLEAISLLLLCY